MQRLVCLAALGLVAGCHGPLVFPCTDDSFCRRAGKTGTCTPAPSGQRYCAFADDTCGGTRWDPTAGEGLGGTCASGAGMPDGGLPPDGGGKKTPFTWTLLQSGSNGIFQGVFGIPDGPRDRVWAVGYYGFRYSPDAAAAPFVRAPLPDEQSHIEFVGGLKFGRRLFIAGNAGLLHSVDDGLTWQTDSSVNDNITAIWGSSEKDVWLVGWPGIHHGGADSFSPVMTTTDSMDHYNAVWGAGPDLFVGDENGLIQHAVNGAGWTSETASAESILGIHLLDLSSAYAVGANFDGNGDPLSSTVLKRRPTVAVWEKVPLDGATLPVQLEAVRVLGPQEILAVGVMGTIIHSTDGGRSGANEASGVTSRLNAIWDAGPDDVYVVGYDGVILHGTR